MNFMKRAVLSCIWALAGLNAAHAWPVKGNPANSGSAILNIGGPEFVPANFINVLKTSETSFSTASDILKIDDDGYLTSTPAGNLNLAFPGFGAMFTNVQYRLRVDGDVQFAKLRHEAHLSSQAISGRATDLLDLRHIVTITVAEDHFFVNRLSGQYEKESYQSSPKRFSEKIEHRLNAQGGHFDSRSCHLVLLRKTRRQSFRVRRRP